MGAAAALLLAICARQVLGLGKDDASDFPEGYDAVTAAPNSHKVLFENALVDHQPGESAPIAGLEPAALVDGLHAYPPRCCLDAQTARRLTTRRHFR
jgi:hypothetical protein